MSRTLRCGLALGLLSAMLAGCGPDRPRRVPVSGRVLIDGEPITTGFVRVVPDDARPAVGKLQSDGSFRLHTFDEGDGCVTGTHRVAVLAREVLNPSELRWLAPKKYHKIETSGKTVTIDGPTDDLEIELTWDGRQPFVERFESEGDIDPANP